MRKIHRVKLNFLQDENTGEYGLTHADTCNNGYGNGFNAFWSGVGIFHDVFEHYQEYSKYFQGDNSLNVGGEMFALGACWYYYDVIGLHGVRELSRNSIYSFSENVRMSTESLIQDAIYSGYCQYGDTLNCAVPKQSPVDNEELEYLIQQLATNVKGFKYGNSKSDKYYSQDEAQYADSYKRSVTFSRIARLHRYGYKQARLLVPDNIDNQNTLRNFIEMFNDFCKNNNAEEMNNTFSGIEFEVRKVKQVIKVKCTLISRYPSEVPDITIRNGNTIYVEDYMVIEEDY